LHPSLSVTQSKVKRIRELAGMYLLKNENEKCQPRFDVISIVLNEKKEGLIEHLENAF
jgi:Holliday junction resolvase-like predicted endonuclease